MSFFTESSTDGNQLVLFSTHKDNEEFKRYLSQLGGTFFHELESQRGHAYPAWVFDGDKKEEVETFVSENEDNESVTSQPDLEWILDELFRRIENMEHAISDMRDQMTSSKPPRRTQERP